VSDEGIVEQWSENMYYQYFTGEMKICNTFPCVATELVMFRQRIGTEGLELVLSESIRVNDDETPIDKDNLIVSVDTTVQEKNITYPTDDKLYKKIIKKCIGIAKQEQLVLRQSYQRTLKKLSYLQRFKNTKHGAKQARKASKRVKTIAGALLRDVERKLLVAQNEQYASTIHLYKRVLSQKRTDTNKIYSLHEPDVKCFSKGKEHKKFEFGSKVSIVLDQRTGIIVAACNDSEARHDSKTIPDVLDQCERTIKVLPQEAYVDRGYRGITTYKQSLIKVPTTKKEITKEQRHRHRNRAKIEPIIGHLKHHYRLCRNFYKGILGDELNPILAAIAMNFKRVMNLWRTEAISPVWQLIILQVLCLRQSCVLHKRGI
jgi:IS5 family transposase